MVIGRVQVPSNKCEVGLTRERKIWERSPKSKSTNCRNSALLKLLKTKIKKTFIKTTCSLLSCVLHNKWLKARMKEEEKPKKPVKVVVRRKNFRRLCRPSEIPETNEIVELSSDEIDSTINEVSGEHLQRYLKKRKMMSKDKLSAMDDYLRANREMSFEEYSETDEKTGDMNIKMQSCVQDETSGINDNDGDDVPSQKCERTSPSEDVDRRETEAEEISSQTEQEEQSAIINSRTKDENSKNAEQKLLFLNELSAQLEMTSITQPTKSMNWEIKNAREKMTT